jgi:hypothetical protein
MRALFVGGPVDNTEIDLEPGDPPQNYPDKRSGGHSAYRLHRVGPRGQRPSYAVYAAREMADEEIERVCTERDYARRFAD